MQIHGYALHLPRSFKCLLEALTLVNRHKVIDTQFNLLEAFFSREIYSSAYWNRFDLDHFWAPSFDDVITSF
jgi:hypothetical protein